MRRFCKFAILLVVMAATAAWAAPPQSAKNVPAFPGALASARYVYVGTYEGTQFNPDVLQQDREAVGAVQNALRQWGKLMIVPRASEADIIILVSSRPSEDTLTVYNAHQWPSGGYVWRVTGRGGLQANETPLVTQFEKAFEGAQHQ